MELFERIERLNPEMHAFITVTPDEGGGFPVSIKDLYDTRGIRTTAGSRVFAKRVPTEDATAVRKLKKAGARIIGKTNLHEFAYGTTGVNPHYGTPRNPWDKERICGGSSAGSACAVALGMGVGSLGTDTGGSIRIPAALCGIVGLKPTYGRVSLDGVIPLCWSLDHAGPMAQTVEETARLLGVIAEHDPGYMDALTGDIQGIRVGIPKTHFYEQVAPAVDVAVRAALKNLEKLGARTMAVELPYVPGHHDVWQQIGSPEAYAFHELLLKAHADAYGADVRDRLEAGRALHSVDYVRAQRTRMMMKQECEKLFQSVDVIVTPTVPIAAPRIDDLQKPWGSGTETAAASLARFTRYFNLTGLPAISVPCGFTPEGLPVGMQIAGKAFDESTVLRVAHAYEQDAGWFKRHPGM